MKWYGVPQGVYTRRVRRPRPPLTTPCPVAALSPVVSTLVSVQKPGRQRASQSFCLISLPLRSTASQRLRRLASNGCGLYATTASRHSCPTSGEHPRRSQLAHLGKPGLRRSVVRRLWLHGRRKLRQFLCSRPVPLSRPASISRDWASGSCGSLRGSSSLRTASNVLLKQRRR